MKRFNRPRKNYKPIKNGKVGSTSIMSNRHNVTRKPITAAESYGWVVEESEAWEAYEFACDYLGKETVDAEIIQGLSTDELAESLAYMFRMYDFREWYNRNGEDEDYED